MPALALADVLPDFGAKEARPTRHAASPPLFSAEEASEPTDQIERAAAVLEARIEEAREAVRDELSRRHKEEMASERQRHLTELDALRTALGEEAGATIAAHLSELEERVVALTTAVTARILSVSLTEELQRRSVGQLARLISEAIGDREAVRVRINGAPLLFDALKNTLGDKAANFEFSESDGFDLNVLIDESIFETRLSEWSGALAEVMP